MSVWDIVRTNKAKTDSIKRDNYLKDKSQDFVESQGGEIAKVDVDLPGVDGSKGTGGFLSELHQSDFEDPSVSRLERLKLDIADRRQKLLDLESLSNVDETIEFMKLYNKDYNWYDVGHKGGFSSENFPAPYKEHLEFHGYVPPSAPNELKLQEKSGQFSFQTGREGTTIGIDYKKAIESDENMSTAYTDHQDYQRSIGQPSLSAQDFMSKRYPKKLSAIENLENIARDYLSENFSVTGKSDGILGLPWREKTNALSKEGSDINKYLELKNELRTLEHQLDKGKME